MPFPENQLLYIFPMWICVLNTEFFSMKKTKFKNYNLYLKRILSFRMILCFIREDAKKILMAAPLRPYPPPPLGLNGSRNFIKKVKKKSKKNSNFILARQLRRKTDLRLP